MSREEPSNRNIQGLYELREGNTVRFAGVNARGERKYADYMQPEQLER